VGGDLAVGDGEGEGATGRAEYLVHFIVYFF